jgi:hypothetical protein
MEEGKKVIKFELADVANKFLFHLKDTTDCITHIYYAIDKFDIDISKPLPTDSFPLTINDNKPMRTIDEQRQFTLLWILTKAFEEFINGLTKSFKETYTYLKIYTLSQKPKYSLTQEEFEIELKKIDDEIEKFHFPNFIDIIEKQLNTTLPLKEEILSINKIRNCLVHRHGTVGEKDVKNSPTDDLQLKWISQKFWAIVDGEQIEVTYNIRKDGIVVSQLSHQTIRNEKIFKIGNKISFDINEFNGIAYTCAIFASNLFLLMPRPND